MLSVNVSKLSITRGKNNNYGARERNWSGLRNIQFDVDNIFSYIYDHNKICGIAKNLNFCKGNHKENENELVTICPGWNQICHSLVSESRRLKFQVCATLAGPNLFTDTCVRRGPDHKVFLILS